MSKYTVLLLRPDYIADEFGHDVYLTHVDAPTPRAAIRAAQDEVRLADGDVADDSADYHPLFVTKGTHQDLTG